MTEQTTITIKRYRCPDGEPTCCRDHPAGETCRFMGVRNFGSRDVCMLGEHRDVHRDVSGWVRPDNACEVWENER